MIGTAGSPSRDESTMVMQAVLPVSLSVAAVQKSVGEADDRRPIHAVKRLDLFPARFSCLR